MRKIKQKFDLLECESIFKNQKSINNNFNVSKSFFKTTSDVVIFPF